MSIEKQRRVSGGERGARHSGAFGIRQLAIGVLLFASGCAQAEHTGSFFKRLGNRFTGKTPVAAVKKMEDPYFPDERVAGINRLVAEDFGKKPPYTERYKQIAVSDEDWLVRATAVRALNRARDKSSTGVFIRALSDENARVRLEGAKALANVPDPAAVGILIKAVNNADEDRDVRIAATQALKHYKTAEVARVLVNTLQGRDFSIAWQARRSLITMTGQDFRYDDGKWAEYLNGPGKPLG